MILAIDTSNDEASVAIASEERIESEISWQARGDHSQRLRQAIPEVLSLARTTPRHLRGIAVALGPGSFNALRVAISTGKGMAMALEIPLAGVGTLDVIGFSAAQADRTVWACLPAGRGELYIASYHGFGGDWSRRLQPTRLPLTAAAELVKSGDSLSGSGSDILAEAVAWRGTGVLVAPLSARFRRAGYLAELSRRDVASQGPSELDRIQPLYLRRAAAEERRAAAGEE